MEILENLPCPGCGCVCDDLTLRMEEGKLRQLQPPCRLAEDWFRRHWNPEPVAPLVDGHSASLEAAVQRSAEILHQADYPLIYGLSRADTSGQRAAVALTEQLGGVVDSTASLCHGPSIMALQETGEVTCTLGEVRNRADLVIFWGCNPAQTHPRHAKRYSVEMPGHWLGGSPRTVVMVGDADLVHDWRLDPDGGKPDLVVPIEPGNDYEALSALTAMLHGDWQGEPPPHLQQLLDAMTSCSYGAIFFGLGLAKTRMWEAGRATQTGHHDVEALLKLVAELNAVTRFTARRMRLQGDVSGADNVLLWQTAYPFGIDFSRGYPRYNPGEFTANELLERGDVDACLVLGAETVPFFTDAARRHLDSIPAIQIDYPGVEVSVDAAVEITTAAHGIHVPGTIYRMDNVPLTLRAAIDSSLPTDAEVLNRISKAYDEA